MNQDELRALLAYEPDTGIFRWLVSRRPRARAGEVAGGDNGAGYIRISIGGVFHYAHRLAFLWMEGEYPSEVDHINQCRSDNRWANLRAANRQLNNNNILQSSGVRQRNGKWEARFRSRTLGRFATKAQATAAYRVAKHNAGAADGVRRLEPSPCPVLRRPRGAFVFQGKTLSEWSRETGIPQPTLYWWIVKCGKSPEQVLGLS